MVNPTAVIEYFRWYIDGEDKALNASIHNQGKHALLVLKLWAMLNSRLIKKVDESKLIFLNYKTQVSTASFLAIVSSLRFHTIQCLAMYRYSLDSIVISTYCMFHADKAFSTLSNKKLSDPDKKLVENSRKWLKEFDPNYNDKIHRSKIVAQHGSHVFISNTGLNIKIEEKYWSSIFDHENILYQKNQLILLSDFLYDYILFIIKYAEDNFIHIYHDKSLMLEVKSIGEEIREYKEIIQRI